MKHRKKNINNTQFISEILQEIETKIGGRYKTNKSQFNIKFERIYFYHNQDRIKFITDSLNPLRKGEVNITTKQNNIIISTKLNHKSFIFRSFLVGLVILSFLYLSFNLSLSQSIILFLSISFSVATAGIFFSEIKIKKIIESAYNKTLQKYGV